jgi:hypothetical protein
MTETTTPVADEQALALLRNDLRGLTKPQIQALVAELTSRMGIDPALAPIDLIADKSGALRVYINARGASELDKMHDISDDDLDVDIRERVVIVKMVKSTPEGRKKRNVGASAFDPERPESLARAIKTAATSAHRRTTMALVGIFVNEPESFAGDA